MDLSAVDFTLKDDICLIKSLDTTLQFLTTLELHNVAYINSHVYAVG